MTLPRIPRSTAPLRPRADLSRPGFPGFSFPGLRLVLPTRAARVWGIAAGSLGVALLVRGLSPSAVHQLPWLMITVAVIAAVYGFRRGLLAMSLVAGLEFALSGAEGIFWAFLLLLTAGGMADQMGRELRRAHRQQQEAAERLSRLVGALSRVSTASSREELLRVLPGLLGSPGGYAAVWLPEVGGLRRKFASGNPREGETLTHEADRVDEVYHRGMPIYTVDGIPQPQDSAPQRGKSGLGNSLALPLFEGQSVAAVLYLEHGRLDPQSLKEFAQTVSTRLTRLSERFQNQVVRQLSNAVAAVASPREVAERALPILARALGMRDGSLMIQQGSRFVALAEQFESNEPVRQLIRQGIPYGQGLLWKVNQSNSPVFAQTYLDDPCALKQPEAYSVGAFMAHPVPLYGMGRSRVVLCLADPQPRFWSAADRELLAAACATLGLALERTLSSRYHETVIQLTHAAVESPPEKLFDQVVEEAVQLVPGAEAGSLLVREGDRFYFCATVGFDREALASISFSEADQREWYGEPGEGWRQGEPRILVSQPKTLVELNAASPASDLLLRAGRLEEIKANLCLPIVYRKEVLALLYLDNFHDPGAFGQDSLEVARAFAAPVAALLHEVRYRKLLEQAALRDPLTGLFNRRAFDRQWPDEVERARRYQYPLALLVMDLRGFKTINDQLGHVAGDQALLGVARTLEATQRTGDSLYRWGGDEFACILPHTLAEGALSVARRYAQAIADLEVGGLSLGVNIVFAVYPQDGLTPEHLLNLADGRMYRAKRENREVFGGQE